MATRDWVTRLKGVLDPSYTGTFGKAARNLETYRKNVFRVNAANNSLSKSSSKAAASTGSVAKSVFKGMAGFTAAYISVQQMGAAIKSVTQNTNEQLAAEKRLQTLMGNVRGTTKKDIGQVKALAGAIQNYSTVGDDVSLHGASQLATYQLQGKSIRKLMPALADLAVGTYGVNVSQEQMQQSANLLGKVFTGQVGALRRVGINFDKHQEKILKTGTEQQKVAVLTKVVAKNYGNLARQMAQTPEGRIIQLKNAWGDFQEEIGLRVLPVVTKVLNWLGPKLPGIMDRGVKALDKIFLTARKIAPIFLSIWNAGSKTFKFLRRNWSWLGPIILGAAGAMAFWYGWLMMVSGAIKVLTAAQWLLNAAMNANPVGLFVLALGLLVGVTWSLIKSWGKVKAVGVAVWVAIGKAWNNYKSNFISGVAGLKESVLPVWNAIAGAIRSIVEWLGKAVDKAKKFRMPKLWPGDGGSPAPAKHARGGIITRPTLTWAGEGYKREAIIPLEQHRSRALSLWRQTGAALGAGGNPINVTYAPVINVGAGANAAQIEAALMSGLEKLKRDLAVINDQERRRSFA